MRGDRILRHTIGFFINPVAGMGGRVGLKGTDDLASMARSLGAEEIAPDRAKEALLKLFRLLSTEPEIRLTILTPESPMGWEICRMALKDAETDEETRTKDEETRTKDEGGNKQERVTLRSIYSPPGQTTAEDTVRFCRVAMKRGAEFILFTGGDGTARDVLRAVDEELPVLGIPSGVKMHSGVFTHTPPDAGKALLEFLAGRATLETREVVDLDEEAYREGKIDTRLFGYAKVPITTQIQGCKNVLTGVDDRADRKGIALGLEEFMDENPGIYILGAGSTLKDIGESLGLKLTPLGFDIVVAEEGNLRLLAEDINEVRILQLLQDFPRTERYLVITPIGAQGFILGRGTQVISSKVLQELTKENIIVVATPGKLAITPILRVDTGEFDVSLRGFMRVMSGYRRYVLKKVE